MVRAVPPRSEAVKEYTWDVESVFPSDEAWEEGLRHVVDDQVPNIARFRGQVGESPQTLLSFLHAEEDLGQELSKLYLYASMRHTVDTSDSEAKGLTDRAGAVIASAGAAVSFGEPEILALGRETLDRWGRETPELQVYEHYFDALFRRQEHVRSSDVEEVLALAFDPLASADGIHGILADSDLTFQPARTSGGEEIEIAQGNIDALLTDTDRELRRTAWENYSDAHLAFKNTMASCLATGVKQHVFLARSRRYDSALEASLSASFIPVEVFYSLIETFRRHLPTWHRYWRVRREALGYDELHSYDLQVPLTTQSVEVPYAQSIDWIAEGMKPLGDEYVEILRRGLTQERWVDVYPNQNKTSGAFSTGTQGTHPFILMSYSDDVYGMSTLAHELGHSLHSYYTWQNQPPVYADYSLFVAEVASNFNQALVRSYLMETNRDPNFQIALIEEAMANFRRYFFIMPTLARFELEIHEREWRGEALSSDAMIELMADLFAEGYGPEVVMDRPRVGITWGEFPTHLYANFYVYQYATGISAAHALAEGVLRGNPQAAEHYLSFLKAGSSLYPLDALKLAGVDLTSPEPVERAYVAMGKMVDRLAELVGDRKTAGRPG